MIENITIQQLAHRFMDENFEVLVGEDFLRLEVLEYGVGCPSFLQLGDERLVVEFEATDEVSVRAT